MATASNVHKLYKSVVDDVINGVKEAFLDEGVDEQVLAELKQLWEGKLQASKALEQPVEMEGTVFTNPAIAMLHQQNSAGRVVQQQPQTVPVPIQINPGSDLTPGGATATMALPPNLFQHQLATLSSQGIRLHQTGNGQLYAMPITAASTVGQASSAISLPQQSAAAAASGQQHPPVAQVPASSVSRQQQQQSQPMPNMIQQIDGAGDTSSSEDDDEDNEDNDVESDGEEKEEEEQGAEEEPLNSDDDVTDDDPAEIFDTDNVIVCQYDKINRNKNKWKFHLKDGIMNLKGRDFVFQRATGDAEW